MEVYVYSISSNETITHRMTQKKYDTWPKTVNFSLHQQILNIKAGRCTTHECNNEIKSSESDVWLGINKSVYRCKKLKGNFFGQIK